MKLITAAIEKKLIAHPMHSQDDKGMDAEILVKFFGGAACTWLVTEAEKLENGDWLFYGYVTMGYEWEWGEFLLSDLTSVKFPPFGLGIERDMYLKPGITVRQYMKEYLYEEDT